MKKGLFCALALSALGLGTTNLFATAIITTNGGVVDISNMDGVLVGVTTSPTGCISFTGQSTCGTASTPILVSPVDPQFGTTGTIKDIASTPITAWKTVSLVNGGTAFWDLLNIITPTGYATCSLSTTSGSCSTGTFVLSQTSANAVSITLTTNERGYTGSSSTGSTPYEGIFTTQLGGNLNSFGCVGTTTCTDTIANILAFEATGGTIRNTWSATEFPLPPSGVPEPYSMVLLGSGLVGLALIRRRRQA